MYRKRLPAGLALGALLALAVGLMLTVLLFLGLRRLERDKIELDFQQRAGMKVEAVRQQLDRMEQVLTVLNQLFVAVGPVTREQFKTFTAPLLDRYPYVQAFNFHRIIPESARADYERSMRARFPKFMMTEMRNGALVPAAPRARHLVVDYIEPMRGNQAAFGLDVAPNADLARAEQRATDTGEASSSKLLQLAQGSGKPNGFLMVMPVYRPGAALDSVPARRRAVIGDTAVVLDANRLIATILGESLFPGSQDLEVSVYADARQDQDSLVYGPGVSQRRMHHAFDLLSWVYGERPEPLVRAFDVAGRSWRMVVVPGNDSYRGQHTGSLASLAGGFLFSLLLAAYLQTLASRSRRIHRLVEQRTAELQLANELLVDDIAARKRAEDGLQLRQRAIEASANAIIITSARPGHYPIEYVNPAFERITGYSSAEVNGRSCSLLWGSDVDQSGLREVVATAREKREGHATLRTYTKSGELFWSDVYIAPVRDETGEVNHFVVALYDITATRRYQEELEFQASRDTLTGLANRNLLRDRLQQAAAYADRYGHPVWVLFLNLDRFKFVNDTLGHRAGDGVLTSVARRLREAVRETDTIARLSADEFVLVLPERTEEALSPAVLQRIMQVVAQPISIDGYEFVMGSSIGVAVCPADGQDADVLLKHAGIAMYRAKELGRNNFQFYTAAMNEKSLERLRIEGDLRNALERDEFRLYYQPQVDLRTGRIVGVEALLRWEHPIFGIVPPARFIQLAEEMGLIVPIGMWVMRAACRQGRSWELAGLGRVRIAVNLSARQFYQQDLADSIKAILDETGLAPQLLELELTESMMMNDVEQAVTILRGLKAIGVHLSIDDFGTGYSSLSYLKRFPIDLLKIDQSFVQDITSDPDDAAIVNSIISLAHSLRLKVTAEGVETEAQLAYLQRRGCDHIQGYYFSRPLAALACERLLREARSLPRPAHAGTTETLLIIDDEPGVLQALTRLLGNEGYRVLTASTPEDAFELLARHPVQVVVCDQRMPLMDGSELLARIKCLYPDTIRIMLSGYAALEAVIEAINRGEIYRFFTKPWDDGGLRAGIREAFAHYRLLHGSMAEEDAPGMQAPGD